MIKERDQIIKKNIELEKRLSGKTGNLVENLVSSQLIIIQAILFSLSTIAI